MLKTKRVAKKIRLSEKDAKLRDYVSNVKNLVLYALNQSLAFCRIHSTEKILPRHESLEFRNFISKKHGVEESTRLFKNVMFKTLYNKNIATKPMKLMKMAIITYN